jgi:hypothetical protein
MRLRRRRASSADPDRSPESPEVHGNTRHSTAGVERSAATAAPPMPGTGPLRGDHVEAVSHKVRAL